MTQLAYSLHGERIVVDCAAAAAAVSAALAVRLDALPRNGDGADEAPPLQFDVAVGAPTAQRPRGKLVYEAGPGAIGYDERDDHLHVVYGDGVEARCDLAGGRAWLTLARTEPALVWALAHPVFTVALVALLDRRGLHAVHAAGASAEGRAVVLAGPSGCGKSTLTTALARAGWRLLGDDTLFLRCRSGEARVLAFPQAIDLADDGLARLGSAGATPLAPGWRKRQLPLPPRLVSWESAPGALLFPTLGDGEPETTITPLDPGAALLALASNVLLADRRSAQSHLDALAALVAASECHRLRIGTDLGAAVRALDALVAEAASVR